METLFTVSSAAMQMKAGEERVRLVYRFAAETVWGNEELLLVLLNNLIDNALKASRPDDTVYVFAGREEEHVIVEVKDCGCGMDEREIARIKEAFYRVDKARSRADGGAGLGLSICDRIAGLHHARLLFSSAPKKGTTAKIIF